MKIPTLNILIYYLFDMPPLTYSVFDSSIIKILAEHVRCVNPCSGNMGYRKETNNIPVYMDHLV